MLGSIAGTQGRWLPGALALLFGGLEPGGALADPREKYNRAETQGLAVGLGLGHQVGVAGGFFAAYAIPLRAPVQLTISPFAGCGTWGEKTVPTRAFFSTGASLSMGFRHRIALDAGYGAIFAGHIYLHHSLVEVLPVYGAFAAVGYEFQTQRGLLVRIVPFGVGALLDPRFLPEFHAPGSGTITATGLLVHEFVHVLQNRDGFPPPSSNTEQSLARAAVIEGDAAWTGDLAVLGFFGRSVGDYDWPDIFRTWRIEVDALAAKDQSVFSSMRRRFAYSYGTPLMHFIQQNQGWSGVHEIMTNTITTSVVHAIVRGKTKFENDMAPPLDFAVPADSARFVVIDTDRLGEWVFRLFLQRQKATIASPVRDNEQLFSDSFSIVRDTSTGGLIVVWRVRSPGLDRMDIPPDGVFWRIFGRSSNTMTIIAASDPTSLLSLSSIPLTLKEKPEPVPGAAPKRQTCYAIDHFGH